MASSSDSTEDFLTLRVEERRARRLRRREKAKAAAETNAGSQPKLSGGAPQRRDTMVSTDSTAMGPAGDLLNSRINIGVVGDHRVSSALAKVKILSRHRLNQMYTPEKVTNCHIASKQKAVRSSRVLNSGGGRKLPENVLAEIEEKRFAHRIYFQGVHSVSPSLSSSKHECIEAECVILQDRSHNTRVAANVDSKNVTSCDNDVASDTSILPDLVTLWVADGPLPFLVESARRCPSTKERLGLRVSHVEGRSYEYPDIKKGDELLSINHVCLVSMPYGIALGVIRRASRRTIVIKHERKSSPKAINSNLSSTEGEMNPLPLPSDTKNSFEPLSTSVSGHSGGMLWPFVAGHHQLLFPDGRLGLNLAFNPAIFRSGGCGGLIVSGPPAASAGHAVYTVRLQTLGVNQGDIIESVNDIPLGHFDFRSAICIFMNAKKRSCRVLRARTTSHEMKEELNEQTSNDVAFGECTNRGTVQKPPVTPHTFGCLSSIAPNSCHFESGHFVTTRQITTDAYKVRAHHKPEFSTDGLQYSEKLIGNFEAEADLHKSDLPDSSNWYIIASKERKGLAKAGSAAQLEIGLVADVKNEKPKNEKPSGTLRSPVLPTAESWVGRARSIHLGDIESETRDIQSSFVVGTRKKKIPEVTNDSFALDQNEKSTSKRLYENLQITTLKKDRSFISWYFKNNMNPSSSRAFSKTTSSYSQGFPDEYCARSWHLISRNFIAALQERTADWNY